MESDRAIAVAAGAGTTVLSVKPGRLLNVLVTAAGTGSGNVTFYDNASAGSGTVIGEFPATVSVGQQYSFGMPAQVGVTAVNPANGPGFTASVR
jgi:hypothetical protein